jgi:hypothetical protein
LGRPIDNRPFESTAGNAYVWTIVSIISFAGSIVLFGLTERWEGAIYLFTIAAVVAHLALIPVVIALPAPTWAKIGGYTLAVVDTILFVAALHGLPETVINPFRYGAHVAAALWPLGVALTSAGFIRIPGYALASAYAGIPLLGALIPTSANFIVVPLFLIWLGAVAWKLRRL